MKQKNRDIEALRCLAILITATAHLYILAPYLTDKIAYFWLGGGVDLFFAVSGYLITRSLIKPEVTSFGFPDYARAFWVRRVFRLWPASILWATLTLFIGMFLGRDTTFGSTPELIRTWSAGVFDVENLYIYACHKFNSSCAGTPLWHYWSLSLEEQFYLILPFVLFFVRMPRLLIVVFFALAGWQAVQHRPWGSLLWFIRSDALLYGVIIALAQQNYPNLFEKLAGLPRRLKQAFIGVTSVLLVVSAREEWSSFYMGFVALAAGLIVLVAALDQDLITRRTKIWRFASFIGARSYSIYLIHLPMFSFFAWVNLRVVGHVSVPISLLWIVLSFALTLLGASLTYRFIEQPLIERGRRLSRRTIAGSG